VSLHALMVGTQVALSLALLVTAGVFARASLNLADGEPGFPLDGKVLVEIDSGIAGMDEPATRTAYARVLDRLRSLPEVTGASMASIVPFGRIRDGRMVRVGSQSAGATRTVIGSGYFETLGLRVMAGREFTPVEEARATEPVAIVDETLARLVFGGRSPIGEFLQLMRGDDPDGGPLRVVGVVAPVRDDMLRPASPHVYVPSGGQFNSMMTFHVHTEPGLEAVTMARAREAIRAVDPQLPVLAVTTMAARRLESPNLGAVRLVAVLFASFGVISLVLSAAGLYGLRAYLVAQRTRELGVRLALGATRGGVLGQLLKEGSVTAAFGITAGLGLGVALVQVLRQSGLLYEVGLVDPAVFVAAPLVLAAATLTASYLPARRALRIDPAVALRPE
jgi:putative ABC transport system permease protein